jgi:anti-anti-sigma factor
MNHHISISGSMITCIMGDKVNCENIREFENQIKVLMDSAKEITFDMNNTFYASSAFLRLLVTAIKKLGKDNVIVINVSDRVKDVMRISGFDRIVCVLLEV